MNFMQIFSPKNEMILIGLFLGCNENGKTLP